MKKNNQGYVGTSYTVIIGNMGLDPECYEIPGLTKWQAVNEARKACKDYPTLPVYVEFFRKSDGCKGYLSRSGNYDTEGHDWNIPHDDAQADDAQADDKPEKRKERRERDNPRIMKNGMMACRRVITHKDGSKDITMTYYGTSDSIRDDKTLHDALSGLLVARTANAVTGGNYDKCSPQHTDAIIQQVYWQSVTKIEIFGPNGIYKCVSRQGRTISECFTS